MMDGFDFGILLVFNANYIYRLPLCISGPESIPAENKDLVDSVQTCSTSTFPEKKTGAKKNTKASVSAVPRLVDNKRKQMEKALSQSKRDHILMNSAKKT